MVSSVRAWTPSEVRALTALENCPSSTNVMTLCRIADAF